jgi:hypothetical protein
MVSILEKRRKTANDDQETSVVSTPNDVNLSFLVDSVKRKSEGRSKGKRTKN